MSLDWKQFTVRGKRGQSQTEKIPDSRSDLVQQYCEDAQVMKVQTDRATSEGQEK